MLAEESVNLAVNTHDVGFKGVRLFIESEHFLHRNKGKYSVINRTLTIGEIEYQLLPRQWIVVFFQPIDFLRKDALNNFIYTLRAQLLRIFS